MQYCTQKQIARHENAAIKHSEPAWWIVGEYCPTHTCFRIPMLQCRRVKKRSCPREASIQSQRRGVKDRTQEKKVRETSTETSTAQAPQHKTQTHTRTHKESTSASMPEVKNGAAVTACKRERERKNTNKNSNESNK